MPQRDPLSPNEPSSPPPSKTPPFSLPYQRAPPSSAAKITEGTLRFVNPFGIVKKNTVKNLISNNHLSIDMLSII